MLQQALTFLSFCHPSFSKEDHLKKRDAFAPTHSHALLECSSLRAVVAHYILGTTGTVGRGPCQRQY